MSKIIIDQKIIDITKCDYNFICLKKETRHEICEINRCVDNKICFLKKKNKKQCNHAVNYANTVICNCPVRIELFEKFDI